MAEQRYRRSLAMAPQQRAEFIAQSRVVRVGTAAGAVPHVTPLWFVWDDEAIWLYSLSTSKRWHDIERAPTVSLLIDDGHEFTELRGVEMIGQAEVVGEVPRTGEPDARLAAVERAFVAKYIGDGAMVYDNRHAWLRIVPETTRSWDHRKMITG